MVFDEASNLTLLDMKSRMTPFLLVRLLMYFSELSGIYPVRSSFGMGGSPLRDTNIISPIDQPVNMF